MAAQDPGAAFKTIYLQRRAEPNERAFTILVPKLRLAGVREIHFRISYPELRSQCRWGKTTRKGELLACRIPAIEDRMKYLGVEGLEYNAIQDVAEAIGRPLESLCVDCALDLDALVPSQSAEHRL